MSQGPGASGSQSSSKEMHIMSDDELVNIIGKSFFNGLQGGTRERHKVPLCMVINFYSIYRLEEDRIDAVPRQNA
jgi:hypothetical protein